SEFAELTDEELSDTLLAAIRADDAAAVTELIALGADVNSIGKIGGVTPILVATLRNNLEIFSLLHEAGADVTITDSSGSSLLHHAANNNAVEIATILLTLDGIDMEHRRDKWEFTPLLLAAFEGNIEMVDLLVSHGANIEANDKWEDTPLNTAAWNGKLEVVQRLVELGAKTDVINVEGKGPLDHARGQKHEDVEAFLLTVIEE
ncbi:MAG: hypothetical protein GY943_08030, partial [Chloroflexi bacterium]|nr:hypothetical protein [Chloroflexota bacterium]